MRDLLVTMIVVGSLPFIIRKPYIGILVFCWISYMNPHRLSWGFAYDAPFAAIVGATTLIAMILSNEKMRIPLKPIMVVWFLWIVWMNVTTIFALESEDAMWEWDRSMKIQLMAWVTIMLCQTRVRLEGLIWIIVISIGFYGVKGGIFTIMTGGAFRVWGPAGTFFGGTNPLALTMLMVLPLMIYLFVQARHRLVRPALLVAMLLTALATVSTYSRGAFVAGAAVAGYLALKSRRKILLIPIILAVLAGTLMFMPDRYFDRIATIETYEEDRSAMGRINAWTVAFNVAKERPFVGGGFQMMSQELWTKYMPDEKMHDMHSIYFEVLGEQGFVGLALYLTLMWLAMREGKRIRRLTQNQDELRWAYDLASYTQVSIVAYAVGGAFLGLAYFDLYYHLIAILLLTGMIVDREQAQTNEDSLAHAGTATNEASESVSLESLRRGQDSRLRSQVDSTPPRSAV